MLSEIDFLGRLCGARQHINRRVLDLYASGDCSEAAK